LRFLLGAALLEPCQSLVTQTRRFSRDIDDTKADLRILTMMHDHLSFRIAREDVDPKIDAAADFRRHCEIRVHAALDRAGRSFIRQRKNDSEDETQEKQS